MLEVVVPPKRTRLFMGNKQVMSIKTWINLVLCCNNTEGDCPRLAGTTSGERYEEIFYFSNEADLASGCHVHHFIYSITA